MAFWPNTRPQLLLVRELFRMLPVWSVKGIRAELKTVSGPRAKDVSLQLCEMLPLAAVAETNDVTGAVRDDRCFLIDISSVRG